MCGSRSCAHLAEGKRLTANPALGRCLGGAVHSTALLESAVAASALYNEVVMMEACEALGLASEPRTVTATDDDGKAKHERS